MKRIFQLTLLSVSLACLADRLCAQDSWPGFRGLYHQGQSPALSLPLHWSVTNNVRWKISIPGEGHSSPIVWGDQAYVTTGYVTSRHASFRRLLRTFILFAACGALLASTGAIIYSLRNSPPPSLSRVLRPGFPALFSCLFGALIVFGPTKMGLEENDLRAWKVSVLCAVLAIMVSAVAAGKRSWWTLLLATVSFSLAASAYKTFPERLSTLWRISSFSEISSVAAVIIPAILGVVLLFFFALARRSSSVAPILVPRGLQWVLIPSSILMAGIYFIDASHLRRTKEMVRAVVCVQVNDGSIRWICEGLPGRQQPIPRANSPATPTPVTDGKQVVAWFGSAGLMSVDLEGKLLWQKTNLTSETRFGSATSLSLHEGTLYVVNDSEEPWAPGVLTSSYVVAIDPQSGREKWRQARPTNETFSGYSTPVVDDTLVPPVLWVRGWADLRSYDLPTGQRQKAFPIRHRGQHLVASPVVTSNRIYLVDAKSIVALDKLSISTTNQPLWTQRSRGEMASSPAIANGLLFAVSENGFASCLDLETGRLHWEERLPGRYFSSILASSNAVYFSNDAGLTSVIAAERQFRRVATNDLGQRIHASLAPAGNRLLVRTADSLYCIAQTPDQH